MTYCCANAFCIHVTWPAFITSWAQIGYLANCPPNDPHWGYDDCGAKWYPKWVFK